MRFAVLAVFAVLFSASAMAERPWKPVGPPLVASLDVDTQGRVTHAQLVGDHILPALQTLTEQTTRNWRFAPATLDGKAAPSRTYASLATEARTVDGNEQLRLRYIAHGPGNVLIVAPAYPPEMIRQSVEAKVIVLASVNADGTLSDVHVVDAKTTSAEKGQLFYRAIIEACKKDRFLPELVDGRPVITHVRIPATFNLIQPGVAAGKLSHATDAPHDVIDDDKSGTSRFADVPVALDSPLKLVSAQP